MDGLEAKFAVDDVWIVHEDAGVYFEKEAYRLDVPSSEVAKQFEEKRSWSQSKATDPVCVQYATDLIPKLLQRKFLKIRKTPMLLIYSPVVECSLY